MQVKQCLLTEIPQNHGSQLPFPHSAQPAASGPGALSTWLLAWSHLHGGPPRRASGKEGLLALSALSLGSPGPPRRCPETPWGSSSQAPEPPQE